MKHFFITLVFLFTINSFSQESLAWVDYEVMIDSKDVPVVLSLLDNHFFNNFDISIRTKSVFIPT